MNLKELGSEVLKKTMLGIIPNLAEVFEGYHYIVSPRGYHESNRLFFFGSEVPSVHSFSKNYKHSLYAQPKLAIQKRIQSMCCEGNLGAFKLIPWNDHGHALLMASDRMHIAHIWIGFVPLSAIEGMQCSSESYTVKAASLTGGMPALSYTCGKSHG
jgi:hypothetical protein